MAAKRKEFFHRNMLPVDVLFVYIQGLLLAVILRTVEVE